MIANLCKWMLGTNLGSSRTAASDLNHWAAPLAPAWLHFFMVLEIQNVLLSATGPSEPKVLCLALFILRGLRISVLAFKKKIHVYGTVWKSVNPARTNKDSVNLVVFIKGYILNFKFSIKTEMDGMPKILKIWIGSQNSHRKPMKYY